MHKPAKKRISEREREKDNTYLKKTNNINNSLLAKSDKIQFAQNKLKNEVHKRVPTSSYQNKNSYPTKNPMTKKTLTTSTYLTKYPKKLKSNTVSVNKKQTSKYLDLISNKSKINQNKKKIPQFKTKSITPKSIIPKSVNPSKVSKRNINSQKSNNTRAINRNTKALSKIQQKKIDPLPRSNRNMRQNKIRQEKKRISEVELKKKNEKEKFRNKIDNKKKNSLNSGLKYLAPSFKSRTESDYNNALMQRTSNLRKDFKKFDSDKNKKKISCSLNKNPYRNNSDQYNHINSNKLRQPSQRNHSKRQPTEIKEFEQALKAIEGTLDSIPSIKKSNLREKTQKSLSKKIKYFPTPKNPNKTKTAKDSIPKPHPKLQSNYNSAQLINHKTSKKLTDSQISCKISHKKSIPINLPEITSNMSRQSNNKHKNSSKIFPSPSNKSNIKNDINKFEEKDSYMSIRLNQFKKKSKQSIKKFSQTHEFNIMKNNKINDQEFLSSPQKKYESNQNLFVDCNQNYLPSISRTNNSDKREIYDDKKIDMLSQMGKDIHPHPNEFTIPSNTKLKQNNLLNNFKKKSEKINSDQFQSSSKQMSKNLMIESIHNNNKETTLSQKSNIIQNSDNQKILAELSNIDNMISDNDTLINTPNTNSQFLFTAEPSKIENNINDQTNLTNKSINDSHKEIPIFLGLNSQSFSSKNKIENFPKINNSKNFMKKKSNKKIIQHNFFKTSYLDHHKQSQKGIISNIKIQIISQKENPKHSKEKISQKNYTHYQKIWINCLGN